MSSEEAEKESTESDFDDEAHVTGSMVPLRTNQYSQKKLDEETKAEDANMKVKDFVTIKDLKDFSNAMLYIIQEIFFRRHQGPGVDDHARTFSSLLLAEVDKKT
ncbi:hypothetical protein Tco_0963493 [Tanacetum coccineum]